MYFLMGRLRVRVTGAHHRGNGVSNSRVIGALSGIILTGGRMQDAVSNSWIIQ